MSSRNKNIKAILFDLDDTLINTRAVFSQIINAVKAEMVDSLSVDPDTFSKDFEEAIITSATKVHLNPVKLWKMTLDILQAKYRFDEGYKSLRFDKLMEIYKILPTLKDRVVETLEILKTSYTIALVTHAEADWAYFKLDGHSLRPLFSYIEIADVNRPKEAQDWLNAVDKLGLKPQDVAIVGDNIKGDMQAGKSIGAGALYWLNDNSSWSFYQQGELPEEIVKIDNIYKLIEELS